MYIHFTGAAVEVEVDVAYIYFVNRMNRTRNKIHFPICVITIRILIEFLRDRKEFTYTN